MMSFRKPASIIVLALVSAGILAAWWYAGEVRQERQAQQQAALEAGIEAFKQNQYDLAVSEFRAVPSAHPEGWQARYLEGSAQIMRKDYARAVPLLEEALALNPTHTRTMHALGVAHYKLGHLSLSKAYFAAVLDVDPGNEEAKGLMDIMSGLERYQEEVKDKQDAAEDVPADVDR